MYVIYAYIRIQIINEIKTLIVVIVRVLQVRVLQVRVLQVHVLPVCVLLVLVLLVRGLPVRVLPVRVLPVRVLLVRVLLVRVLLVRVLLVRVLLVRVLLVQSSPVQSSPRNTICLFKHWFSSGLSAVVKLNFVPFEFHQIWMPHKVLFLYYQCCDPSLIRPFHPVKPSGQHTIIAHYQAPYMSYNTRGKNLAIYYGGN